MKITRRNKRTKGRREKKEKGKKTCEARFSTAFHCTVILSVSKDPPTHLVNNPGSVQIQKQSKLNKESLPSIIPKTVRRASFKLTFQMWSSDGRETFVTQRSFHHLQYLTYTGRFHQQRQEGFSHYCIHYIHKKGPCRNFVQGKNVLLPPDS